MNYALLQAMASKLINSFGNGAQADIIYVNAPNAGKKQKIACVVVQSDETGNDGSVHGKTQTAYVSGTLKVAPQANDYITLNKKTYTVIAVDDITPDGKTTCLYKLTVSS